MTTPGPSMTSGVMLPPQPSPVRDLRAERLRSVDTALSKVVTSLEKDQELKKAVREALEPIEDVAKLATAELNKLHFSHISYHIPICRRCLEIVRSVRPLWTIVATLIPPGDFYRYQFALGPVMRALTTVIVEATFLLSDNLATAKQAAEIMGVADDSLPDGGLMLTAEDYLQAVIGAVNDFPRLSINSVTAGNYQVSMRIATFVNDIFAAYSQLNLRNDSLRRKFDSLKYDLKRCEDVVYDITIRGLIRVTPTKRPAPLPEISGSATAAGAGAGQTAPQVSNGLPGQPSNGTNGSGLALNTNGSAIH